MNKTFLCIIIFSLTGCTSIQSYFCERKGGAPHVNLGGYQYCANSYSDGGKECTDSSECEGRCYLSWEYNADKGGLLKGACESNDIAVNKPCYYIEGGEVKQGLCLEE